MVKKEHCDKHYRFVATCPDCRSLNENNGDEDVDDVQIEWGLYNNEDNEWTIEIDDLSDGMLLHIERAALKSMKG